MLALVRSLIIFFVLLNLDMWVMCLLYLGSSHNLQDRRGEFNIYCVDLDHGFVGSALRNAMSVYPTSPSSPSMILVPLQTEEEVKQAVDMGEAWAAIIANENASRALTDLMYNITQNNTFSFTPEKAITVYFDEGRHPMQVNARIMPFVKDDLSEYFRETLVQGLIDEGTIQLYPHATLLVRPISYTMINLHPASWVGHSANTIGIIFHLTICYMWTMLFNLAFVRHSPPKMHFMTRILIYHGLVVLFTFFTSLAFASVVAIFEAVSSPYFFYYWMLHWLQEILYCYCMHTLLMIFREFIGLVFVLFLLVNLTGGLGLLEMAHDFYLWGYGTPFYHSLNASRFILYGSNGGQIALHVGVMIGMLAASFVIVNIGFALQWMTLKKKLKKEGQEERAKKPTEEESEELTELPG